jgi:3-methyladenine DNA glycosylase/8-oxoguanine DNA glycosylase
MARLDTNLFGRKVEYLRALGRSAEGYLDTEMFRALPEAEALRSCVSFMGSVSLAPSW